MLDVEWIPTVAELQLVAITRDKGMRTRRAEREAMVEHQLRCVWIGGKRDQSSWTGRSCW